MAHFVPVESSVNQVSQPDRRYTLPMVAMTTLFFMWGFITVLNDLLIPHLKALFELNYTQVMLIQFCFFGAYFLVSIPAGKLIRKIGYKSGVIVGLLIGACGCFLFYPAAIILEYPLFLFALFVLASGLTILQVSANPYVAALGPQETASSRLNLAQGLNSLGTTLAPLVGAYLFFTALGTAESKPSAESLPLAYLMIAICLITIACIFAWLNLPKISIETDEENGRADATSIIQAKHLIWGVFAIFFYVGAEVSIGSFLVNYFGETDLGGLSENAASKLLGYYWGGAMVGRFIGSFATRYIAAYKAVLFNAVCIILLLILTMLTKGQVALWSVLAIGLFNSIMFPTIFTMAIEGLGTLTSRGSGVLCLAIVGGAIVPMIQGTIADTWTVQFSFIVPLVCYCFIGWYAYKAPALINHWNKMK